MVPRGAALSLPGVRPASWPRPFASSILLGLAHAASMAAPWNGQAQGWLQILSMAGLVGLLLLAPTARSAALRAWLFAVAWLCGTFWWLYISMHTYGGLAAPLAGLAVLALGAVLSVYYAAAGWFFRTLGPGQVTAKAMVFAALWTLAEMARGTWFTGFGWGAAAYAHVDGLGALARHVGAYGVGFIAAFMAASVGVTAMLLLTPARTNRVAASAKGLAPVVLLLAIAALPVREVSTPAGELDIALLQGNIKQSEKFQAQGGVADALQWYGAQAARLAAPPTPPAGAAPLLVVMPETAVPLLPSQLPDGYLSALEAPFRKGPHALLTGIPLGSFADGYTNSVRGVGAAAAQPYRYDKHHLVPFGEFIPPLFKWFTQMMNIPLGDFTRGTVGQASFAFAGQRLAPNICYEDLFGEELAARFADPARAPTVMVNISNIGWFGDSLAIDQHRNISRMRALEFERPMVRATNTGDTVVIDHHGQVSAALARHTRGVLLAQVQGRGPGMGGDGITPFAWWASRLGLWPLWIVSVSIVFMAYRLNKYRTKSSD